MFIFNLPFSTVVFLDLLFASIKHVIYRDKQRRKENDAVAILFFQRNSSTKEYRSHH